MIQFLYNNLAPQAAITSNSEDLFFPLSNLLHPFRSKKYKVDSQAITKQITFDFGQPVGINAVAMVDTNFLAIAGGYTLTAGNTLANLFTTPNFTFFNIPFSDTFTQDFAYKTYRYWGISFPNTTAIYEIGYCFFGVKLEPSRNFNLGWKDKIVDISTTSRSIGGQTHSDIKDTYRQIEINFNLLLDTDKVQLLPMLQTVGTHTDFVINLDPDRPAEKLTFYGKIAKASEFKSPYTDRYSLNIVFNEAL